MYDFEKCGTCVNQAVCDIRVEEFGTRNARLAECEAQAIELGSRSLEEAARNMSYWKGPHSTLKRQLKIADRFQADSCAYGGTIIRAVLGASERHYSEHPPKLFKL